jgi:hypothetical protein
MSEEYYVTRRNALFSSANVVSVIKSERLPGMEKIMFSELQPENIKTYLARYKRR